MKRRIVVVGHGMVGHRFLESLAQIANGRDAYDVVVLGEEPRAAYDRVHLSEYFAGRSAEDLSLVASDFFANSGYQLRLNACVTAIDRDARRVTLADGASVEYDTLVLATGSRPFVPPIAGRDRDGCFVYRTIDDLDAIRAHASGAKIGTVVGGGLLGLECAKALRDLGLETHVVEFAPRLMAVQIDAPGAQALQKRIEELGVHVHLARNTTAIEAGETAAHRMAFADGTALETDLIVFSAGIRPRDELARACGLTLGARGGIAIDDQCRSSDANIYAIGECAAWNDNVYGLVAPGYDMARVAAASIAENAGSRENDAQNVSRFTGADMSTKLKLMGVDVASIGDAHGATPGARSYQLVDEHRNIYKKLVLSADGKRLLGAVLVGDASEYGTLLQFMLNAMALPASPESLILPAGGGAPVGLGVDALPGTAIICSCNNVTKAQLCDAVIGGATTLAELKSCTRAATSCGGCAALVSQVMKAELKRQGVAVSNHLCEHFPYSRQQLHDLVRVENIRSFPELLKRHGTGLGCDICKPVAASIFASCWNDFVLEREHAPLQDSNDYYLANIQKDGTYSVVPRIAGGEITPDGLMTIARVAKKFGLYTKITGGQRIDLFGAQVHQLPAIWSELIDAGFESGHAYGKAVRTVKSCVGSTWCRYGVQDSVGFAIEIENRYKGVRAPHKLKFAVSGCTRECAEAQSKDVGVIATEKGWNLYVCGNGGMKPRHAELLASDLDRETLLRYTDRFLMFYIRTADRLQRTSTWRDAMEGGIEYLRDVVVNDSLGIAAELEADMARVIAGYVCEWKKAVEDPAVAKRFRTFVNDENNDPGVAFARERGQIRPATRAERELWAIETNDVSESK